MDVQFSARAREFCLKNTGCRLTSAADSVRGKGRGVVAARDIQAGEVVLSEVALACSPLLQSASQSASRRPRCSSCRSDARVGGIRSKSSPQVIPACPDCADWIVQSGFVEFLHRETQFAKDNQHALSAELAAQACLAARLLWHLANDATLAPASGAKSKVAGAAVSADIAGSQASGTSYAEGDAGPYFPVVDDVALMQTFSEGSVPAGITHADVTRKFRESKGGRVGGVESDAAEVSKALENLSKQRLPVVQRAAVLLLVGSQPRGKGGARAPPLVQREWLRALREASGVTSDVDGVTSEESASLPEVPGVPEVVVEPGSASGGGAAHTLAQDAALLSRLILAFDLNNFAATGDDLSQHSDAVCPLLAALNHDCSPNCAVEWAVLPPPEGATEPGKEPSLSRARLVGRMRALRNVREGEELTHSFCDPTDDVVSRADRLAHLHGFACACDRCAEGVTSAMCAGMPPVHGWAGKEEAALRRVLEGEGALHGGATSSERDLGRWAVDVAGQVFAMDCAAGAGADAASGDAGGDTELIRMVSLVTPGDGSSPRRRPFGPLLPLLPPLEARSSVAAAGASADPSACSSAAEGQSSPLLQTSRDAAPEPKAGSKPKSKGKSRGRGRGRRGRRGKTAGASASAMSSSSPSSESPASAYAPSATSSASTATAKDLSADLDKAWSILRRGAEAAALSSQSDAGEILGIVGAPCVPQGTKSRCLRTHAALCHTARQVFIKLMPDDDDDQEDEERKRKEKEDKSKGNGEAAGEPSGADDKTGRGKSWSAGQVAILSLAAGHIRRAGQLLDSAGEEMRRSSQGTKAWAWAAEQVGKVATGSAAASAGGTSAESTGAMESGTGSTSEDRIKVCSLGEGIDPRDAMTALRVLEGVSVCQQAEKAMSLVATRTQSLCEAAGVALWMFVTARICLLVSGVSPTSALGGSMAKAVLDEGLLCLSAQQRQGSYGVLAAGVKGVHGGVNEWVDASMGAWVGAGMASCHSSHPAVRIRATVMSEARAMMAASRLGDALGGGGGNASKGEAAGASAAATPGAER